MYFSILIFYIAFSQITDALDRSRNIVRNKYRRIMTMEDSSVNEISSSSTIATTSSFTVLPIFYPIPDWTPQIPTVPITTMSPKPHPTAPMRSGTSKAVEKCNEYHDWLIRRSSFQFFIIKGTPAIGKEFPHMAALGYGSSDNIQWLCGGSLVSESYVLTAAHCLKSMELGEVRWVKLGATYLTSPTPEASSETFSVIERVAHPSYSTISKYNDIALLRLDRPVEFSEYILPICLSTTESDVNERLTATGWGKTEVNGQRSNRLMRVDLDYFPNEVCRQAYSDVSKKDLPEGVLADRQICAGSKTDARDTCQGDSGGPLQINTDKLYLVGITSIGKTCGLINVPAIYTRVLYYVPWIEQIVWKE